MEESDIAAQFSAFVHAPIPYVAEALLVAGVVWTVSRVLTRDTVDALRERLSLARDRLQKANEEADAIRAKLAARDRSPVSAPGGHVESAVVQAAIVDLMRGNSDALSALAKPLRRGTILPGTERVAPLSSKGPASRPDERR
jgi:hypothetical protein